MFVILFHRWFSEQTFQHGVYEKLKNNVRNFPKAHACFKRQWVAEDSVLEN